MYNGNMYILNVDNTIFEILWLWNKKSLKFYGESTVTIKILHTSLVVSESKQNKLTIVFEIRYEVIGY